MIVKNEMFFDKEIQQDVIKPKNKQDEDVLELSSEKAEIEGEQIEEEEEEKEECVSKDNITKILPFITEMENIRRKPKMSGTMQQDFDNQRDLKLKYCQARVDSSYQEVKHELNQNIRIEQSLSEMRYEGYFDFVTDAHICLSLSQLQSLTHNGKLNVYDDKDKINYKRRKKKKISCIQDIYH